jgi:pSer/pThr/pTyr-binding forkhead associated (FHA) protein
METIFTEEHPMAGREIRIEPGTVVGRSGADIELADPEVSRRHATFRQVDSGIGVEDLGSRNGTFVNDRPVAGITSINEGDTVRFGNTIWRLGTGGEGATRAAAAPAAPRDPDRPPTGIRRAIAAEPVYGEALPRFDPSRAPSPVLGRSAARRVEAMVYSYGLVIATAVGVTVYFIQR